MVTFYVIRHGETEKNRDGVLQGQMDEPLSAAGRKQASFLAEALRPVGFDAVYTSDLSRAAQTARAIMAGRECPLVFDRRLREIHMGKLQGLTRLEVTDAYPDYEEARRLDPVNTRRPGGESLADLRERVCLAVDDIYRWARDRPGGSTLAIVAHGGVIGCILRRAGAGTEPMRHAVDNCSITVLERDGDEWTVVKLNDGAHLPPAT